MVHFLTGLVRLFISFLTSESAKVLAKHLFSKKQNPTLTLEKRNKGRKP